MARTQIATDVNTVHAIKKLQELIRCLKSGKYKLVGTFGDTDYAQEPVHSTFEITYTGRDDL